MITVVIFILILLILVLSHELGHFIVAKRARIRVDEFGFGFPPRILGKKIGGTLYSINWLPFGGFVKIFGEDNETPMSLEEEKVSFARKPKLIQAMVLIAGVVFNLILAWLIFIGLLATGMPASSTIVPLEKLQNPKLTIVDVATDSPALKAGLKDNDQIIQVIAGDEELTRLTPEGLRDFILQHGKENLTVVTTNGQTTLSPALGVYGNEPAIGVALDLVGTYRVSWYRAPIESTVFTARLTWLTMEGYYTMIKNLVVGRGGEVLAAVSGPVGIAGLIGQARSLGAIYVFVLAAIISISLAILNLMPFPALDGGRLLFLIIEAIKGSPIKPKVALIANFTGFALLILLLLIVTYNDILRLITH